MNDISDGLAGQFDRLPPHSIDAEMCVIASAMLSRRVWEDCKTIIGRDHFYLADHQIIWDCICGLYAAGKPVDAVLVREALIRAGTWEDVGGKPALAGILNIVPSAAHGSHYAAEVAEKYRRRELIGFSNDTLRACYAPTGESDPSKEILHRAQAKLAAIAGAGMHGTIQSIGDMLSECYESLEATTEEMVKTGFTGLDDATGGIGIGEHIILGARPSMGKSVIARQMCIRSGKIGQPTALVTLEETGRKIGRNVFASECVIENNKLRRRNLSQDDWSALTAGLDSLSKLPCHKIENNWRADDIHADLSLLKARHGIKLAIVDYLQLVRAGGRGDFEQATQSSKATTAIFKELGIAGISTAQLNRQNESRDNHRPRMADIRSTGQIEQDADGVIFLHREDYYRINNTGDGQPIDNVAELSIAKWRDAERGGTIFLKSCLQYQTFEDHQKPDPFS